MAITEFNGSPQRKPPQSQHPTVEMVAASIMLTVDQIIEKAANGDEEQATLIKLACAALMQVRAQTTLATVVYKKVK